MHRMGQRPLFPRTPRPRIRRPTIHLTVLNKSSGTQLRDPSAIRTMTLNTSLAFGPRAPLHWTCESLIPIQAPSSAALPFLSHPPAMLSSHHLQFDKSFSSLPHLRSGTHHLIPPQRQLMQCITALTSPRYQRGLARATCLRDKVDPLVFTRVGSWSCSTVALSCCNSASF